MWITVVVMSPHHARLVWEANSQHRTQKMDEWTRITVSLDNVPPNHPANQLQFWGSKGSTVIQNLTPGWDYVVHVACGKDQLTTDRACVRFRACFTRGQLTALHNRAVMFQNEPQNFRKITYLYRNKPYGYYSQVQNSPHKVELAYMKDYNGDPANPINGRITGLFFNGRIRANNDLEPASPFGNCRLILPVNHLVNSNNNLYFADFYCNSSKQLHYVTVVVTLPGSPQDHFCQQHLPQLDPYQNPYIFLQQDQSVWLNHSSNLRIEILYAGNVDTTKGFFTHTETIGKGFSTVLGIPKKANCTVCNLPV